MVRLLLILGWFAGSGTAVAALLLGGSGVQAALSVFFGVFGLGLIVLGGVLVISTMVHRPTDTNAAPEIATVSGK